MTREAKAWLDWRFSIDMVLGVHMGMEKIVVEGLDMDS
jgi:hypothetical protein